jgi:hypothetical protein
MDEYKDALAVTKQFQKDIPISDTKLVAQFKKLTLSLGNKNFFF